MSAAPSAAHLAALEWQVTLWSGEVTPEERDAFSRWRDARPEHARAWAEIERMGLRLRAAPDPVASAVLRQAARPTSRRRVLGGLGTALAAGGLAGMASMDTPPWRTACADLRTRVGERRQLVLPDGSRLALNSGSAADLHFTAQERRVRLHAGELLVTTARDPSPAARPFLVDTVEGRMQALGTRFSVRRLEAATTVQVFEGAVEATPVAGMKGRIDTGRQARLDRHHMGEPTAVDPTATAWERGLLVVDRQPLAGVVAELARHRPGVLRCDPAVAGLVVSGVYRIDDTDAALAALAGALPVTVRTVSPWWVTVSPRRA